MPHQETAFRRDKVVYWEFVRPDRHNEPQCLLPRELKVAWNDKKTDMRDPQGDKVACDAQIVGAEDLVVRSIVAHQGMDYFAGTGSAEDPTELYQVVAFAKTPDIKNRGKSYVFGLVRYKNQLPEVVT